MAQFNSGRPLVQSLKEYSRGIAGGLLFSFPMLYTMEVWWTGFIAEPEDLLVLVCTTYLLLLGYNRYAGMHPGVSWQSVVVDSFEELGLGLLISFGMLLMLNRINIHEMGLYELMGKVVVEAMAVSIGVSVGTAQLGIKEEDKAEDHEEVDMDSKVSMFVLALCGSILIGGNVAPTDEVMAIALELSPVHVLAMVIVSLVLCVMIVYFSNFKGTGTHQSDGLLYSITFDTALCYVTAIGASAFMLWFFGRFSGIDFWTGFSEVIALSVITSMGASAGRLLIKS